MAPYESQTYVLWGGGGASFITSYYDYSYTLPSPCQAHCGRGPMLSTFVFPEFIMVSVLNKYMWNEWIEFF